MRHADPHAARRRHHRRRRRHVHQNLDYHVVTRDTSIDEGSVFRTFDDGDDDDDDNDDDDYAVDGEDGSFKTRTMTTANAAAAKKRTTKTTTTKKTTTKTKLTTTSTKRAFGSGSGVVSRAGARVGASCSTYTLKDYLLEHRTEERERRKLERRIVLAQNHSRRFLAKLYLIALAFFFVLAVVAAILVAVVSSSSSSAAAAAAAAVNSSTSTFSDLNGGEGVATTAGRRSMVGSEDVEANGPGPSLIMMIGKSLGGAARSLFMDERGRHHHHLPAHTQRMYADQSSEDGALFEGQRRRRRKLPLRIVSAYPPGVSRHDVELLTRGGGGGGWSGWEDEEDDDDNDENRVGIERGMRPLSSSNGGNRKSWWCWTAMTDAVSMVFWAILKLFGEETGRSLVLEPPNMDRRVVESASRAVRLRRALLFRKTPSSWAKTAASTTITMPDLMMALETTLVKNLRIVDVNDVWNDMVGDITVNNNEEGKRVGAVRIGKKRAGGTRGRNLAERCAREAELEGGTESLSVVFVRSGHGSVGNKNKKDVSSSGGAATSSASASSATVALDMLRIELWKWCTLLVGDADGYVDIALDITSSPLEFDRALENQIRPSFGGLGVDTVERKGIVALAPFVDAETTYGQGIAVAVDKFEQEQNKLVREEGRKQGFENIFNDWSYPTVLIMPPLESPRGNEGAVERKKERVQVRRRQKDSSVVAARMSARSAVRSLVETAVRGRSEEKMAEAAGALFVGGGGGGGDIGGGGDSGGGRSGWEYGRRVAKWIFSPGLEEQVGAAGGDRGGDNDGVGGDEGQWIAWRSECRTRRPSRNNDDNDDNDMVGWLARRCDARTNSNRIVDVTISTADKDASSSDASMGVRCCYFFAPSRAVVSNNKTGDAVDGIRVAKDADKGLRG